MNDVFEMVTIGKTDAHGRRDLVIEAIRQIDKPNYQALIINQTDAAIRDIQEISRVALSGTSVKLIVRPYGYDWVFDSGAKLLIRKIQSTDDAYKFAGREFQYIAFNNPTLLTEYQYDYMVSRVRTIHNEIKCYIRSIFVEDHCISRRFIDQCKAPDKNGYNITYFKHQVNETTKVFETVECDPDDVGAFSRAYLLKGVGL